MTTSSQPQSQCSLGHCDTEADRGTFGPLGLRTTPGVGDLDVEGPADPGGASWFVASATSDFSVEGPAPRQSPRLQPWLDFDAESRIWSGSFFEADKMTTTRCRCFT